MELKTPLEILGLALGISGAIAGSYIIIERLIKTTLFSLFLKAIPLYIQSLIPYDATINRFIVHANRDFYSSWDVAFIYLLLMPIIFVSFAGCWVFLVLKLLGILDIGTIWLIIWFIFIAIIYWWSASAQYAWELKFHDRRLGKQGIMNRMWLNPFKTVKRWNYYFWSNWFRAPYTTLKLLLIVALFVLLHWPAWLIQIIPTFRFDITIRKNRRWSVPRFRCKRPVIISIFKLPLQRPQRIPQETGYPVLHVAEYDYIPSARWLPFPGHPPEKETNTGSNTLL
jgi:hypothetical protein